MSHSMYSEKIFSIRPMQTVSTRRKAATILTGPLEYVLGLNACERMYQRLAAQKNPQRFMRDVLDELNIRALCSEEDRAKVPQTGACVVVANHPFGAVEGIILAEMLLSIRSDVKILANFLLDRIPQMRSLMFAVDPFEQCRSVNKNMAPMRNVMRFLKDDGLLLVFPAGEVSHYDRSRYEVSDPPWNVTVARIVRSAKATVLPIYFQGRNSLFFQIAGCVHPRLRTILLVRELLRQKNKQIEFKVGNPISYRWLKRYLDDHALTDYLRWRTYIMGHQRPSRSRLPYIKKVAAKHRGKPIAGPQDPQALKQEIGRLPMIQRLVQSGPFSVWQAAANQIPCLLLEIGRLREISFRQAGEGTGKPSDIDRFDTHYTHLFIWDEMADAIVGSYRIGRTDKILAAMGKQGLYTNTLFRSQMNFYKHLGPALEMGRSFIRPEYQRSYSSLLLLWKGIGAFVAQYPQYRMLFGPVSISRDFSDLSRRLLATTLLRHSQAKDLALMVRPRKSASLKPIRVRGCDHTTHDVQFMDFKEVCSVVADIEIEKKEVPVLLRQYLNLGGQLLSFNIDKKFSSVMDGLIVVDLLQTERRSLERYMGKGKAGAFLAYHTTQMRMDVCEG